MFITRRVLIIIVAVLVVIIGGLGIALFVSLSNANSAPAASASTPTVTTSPTKTTNPACVAGIVQSVNSNGQSFVVSENKGKKTVTVEVNDQTTYMKRGQSAAFTDIAVGDRVRVIAQGTCNHRATTILASTIAIMLPAKTPTPTTSPTP
jgi:maltose-binding protein MalE